METTAAEREQFIQSYVNGPARIKTALQKVPQEARKWRPAPGKWSVHEVIWHCADSELNAASRIRYLLAENEPLIVGYDQDRWASTLQYQEMPLESALAVVEAVHAYTAPVLRQVPDEVWGKKGKHTEIKEAYTPEMWLKIYAGHLEVHAKQIERNLEAWKKRAGR